MTLNYPCKGGILAVAAILGLFAPAFSVFPQPLSAAPNQSEDVTANLAQMPRPWTRKIHQLTLAEYIATLKYWAEVHPRILSLQKRGQSSGGLPLFLLKITDPSIPDKDKQICLITALHGGPERSGSTTALRLAEWLLGSSAEATEIRVRQIVLIMPIPNPYAYFISDRFGNEQGIDVYNPGPKWWDFKALRLIDPKKTPEVAAVVGVMDEFKPDVHADLHGIGLQEIPQKLLGDRTMYQGTTMFDEVVGAVSNYSLRPWDWRINEVMDAAARQAGYGLDHNEADAQRILWGPDFEAFSDKIWLGRPHFYTAHYGYMKYHTMITALEIGWEESGVARMRGLLGIGNRPWIEEDETGYPVNTVREHDNLFVTAYGGNAAERRRSRIELWSKQGDFGLGCIYPQTVGHGLFLCAVSSRAVRAADLNLDKFLANLGSFPELKADVVRKFVRAGPECRFWLQGRGIHGFNSEGREAYSDAVSPMHGYASSQGATEPIENGIGLRVRIPYRHPKFLDIRLNGEILPENASDGFHTWFADGWTHLQVNVPPAKARGMEMMIVTYAYKPDVVRTSGFVPPAEVERRLNAGK